MAARASSLALLALVALCIGWPLSLSQAQYTRTGRLIRSCFRLFCASRSLSYESWSGRGAGSLLLLRVIRERPRVPLRQHHRHPCSPRPYLRTGPLWRSVRGALHVEVPGHQGCHWRLHGGKPTRVHLLFSLLRVASCWHPTADWCNMRAWITRYRTQDS
jgi:hypothetical protein